MAVASATVKPQGNDDVSFIVLRPFKYWYNNNSSKNSTSTNCP